MRVALSIVVIIAVIGIAALVYQDWQTFQEEEAVLILNPSTMTYKWSTRAQLKSRNQKAGYSLPAFDPKYSVKIVISEQEAQ